VPKNIFKRGYEEIRDRKVLEILKKDQTWLKYELHCNVKDYTKLYLNIICNRSFFLFWNDVSFVPVRVLYKDEKILGRKHIYLPHAQTAIYDSKVVILCIMNIWLHNFLCDFFYPFKTQDQIILGRTVLLLNSVHIIAGVLTLQCNSYLSHVRSFFKISSNFLSLISSYPLLKMCFSTLSFLQYFVRFIFFPFKTQGRIILGRTVLLLNSVHIV
jgi:hypothetical protein